MGMHRSGGPTALAGKKSKRSRPMKTLLGKIFGYLGSFKREIIFAFILTIIATAISSVDPLFLTLGIDLVLDPNSTFFGIIFLGVIYVVLRVISWTLMSGYTWVLSGSQAGFAQSIQKDVYDKLVYADLSYHKSEQSGNVTSRVTSDIENLATGIQIVSDIASQMLLLVITFSILWITSPMIALTALIVVPAVIFIVIIFGTVGQRTMLASQRASGIVSGQIAENLSGIHVAKAFNREKEISGKLKELNQKAYSYGYKFMMLMTLMQPLIRGTGVFALSAILFVGAGLAIGTAPLLTIGQVVLGTMLVQRFLFPLLGLTMYATQFQASLSSMDRVLDVIEATPAIVDSEQAIPLSEESDGITFKNVSFAYEEDKYVLKDLNFGIKAGETVAIVGHTGAGKTTIASLINRFYDPQKGSIYVGEKDLKDVTLESLHDKIALIVQHPYLFDGTIYENIRYGKEDATNEEIIELCKLIGSHDFIDVLPQQYDTVITESGKNLSAGQIQMIAIARTMLADPKILILDEATSRLDAYSESLVQAAQEKLFSDRTTVVIAHRLTTIANASRILVFEEGKLIEKGTHKELISIDGKYKKLYDTYYAFQGTEEVTEEVVKTAEDELSKIKKVEKPDGFSAMKEKMMKQFGSGMSKEDMEKMKEKMKKMKEQKKET
ncbi:MAG: ABC transporter ATP-binding protein [Candidatus Ranarchaeia archaeon]